MCAFKFHIFLNLYIFIYILVCMHNTLFLCCFKDSFFSEEVNKENRKKGKKTLTRLN